MGNCLAGLGKAAMARSTGLGSAVQVAKIMPQRVPVPGAPKKPNPLDSIGERLVDGLASLVGIESKHQRAVKKYATAMTAWREEAQKAKLKDARAWEEMRAVAAIHHVARNRKRKPDGLPPVSKPGFNAIPNKRPTMR